MHLSPEPRRLTLFDQGWKVLRKWKHYPYVTYEAIAFVGRKRQNWRFMNYGFEALDGKSDLHLDAEDEAERFSAQLYHFVGQGAAIEGKDVLEVGSGRGGGASLIHREFKGKSMTGMDFSPRAVDFCQQVYSVPGLKYVVGDAMDLPFEQESFDVVVNVESAHLYPDPELFIREVFRVLRPGGTFLYSDVLPVHMFPAVRARLEKEGFEVQEERDISAEVLRALDLDSSRRSKLVHAWTPFFLKSFGGMFAVVAGSYPHEKLRTGKSIFFRTIAKKA
jgi:ubiquinone/menaquinone biosynthesis C-methylase UbiE